MTASEEEGKCDLVTDCVYSNGYYSPSLALKDIRHLILPEKFATVALKRDTRGVIWLLVVVTITKRYNKYASRWSRLWMNANSKLHED